MKKNILLLLLLSNLSAFAQRAYSINDSTHYELGNTKITVGRTKVYRNVNDQLTLIRDFANASEPNYYLRDFDFIDADSWYVLFGSRYIGAPTELYRTDDAGVTWQLLTPTLSGVSDLTDDTANSINQIQIINHRIYLFDNYYQSRVVYSDNDGQTWIHWFESFWSHWYQIYTCDNSLYIHGLPGDGFRAYMTEIPSAYMNMTNIQTVVPIGSCHNGNTPGCYYAPASISVPEIYNHFKNLFETSICPTLGVEVATQSKVELVPNPTNGWVEVKGIVGSGQVYIEVFDALGQRVKWVVGETLLDLSELALGVYWVKFKVGEEVWVEKVVRG